MLITKEGKQTLKPQELKVLKILELGLPSVYTLFHSTGWSLGPKKSDVRGEADIIAVNQAGDILLMEVKSGSVDFTADGIFKEYDGGPDLQIAPRRS